MEKKVSKKKTYFSNLWCVISIKQTNPTDLSFPASFPSTKRLWCPAWRCSNHWSFKDDPKKNWEVRDVLGECVTFQTHEWMFPLEIFHLSRKWMDIMRFRWFWYANHFFRKITFRNFGHRNTQSSCEPSDQLHRRQNTLIGASWDLPSFFLRRVGGYDRFF